MVELVGTVSVSYPKSMGCSKRELKDYIKYVDERTEGQIESLKIIPVEDGEVTLEYENKQRGFERIRRITGYLVGTTDRWNNAKQSEEKDRVKHGL